MQRNKFVKTAVCAPFPVAFITFVRQDDFMRTASFTLGIESSSSPLKPVILHLPYFDISTVGILFFPFTDKSQRFIYC
jgi:hypothetical protein